MVNYLGRVGESDGSPWSVAPEAQMLHVPPREDRKPFWALEINAVAVGDQLRVGLISQHDVTGLVERLREALSKEAVEVSLVDISMDDIAEFEEELDTW